MANTKSIYELVTEALPELLEKQDEFLLIRGSIMLVSDETGDWIAKWDYATPLPDFLKSYLR
jgi:hypothetical protein